MKKAAVFAVASAFIVLGCSQEDPIEKAEDVKENDVINDNSVEEKEIEEKDDTYSWNYTETIDEMTSEKNLFAQILSPKVANFDFPYEGGSIMKLVVRELSGDEDVFLKVSQGQFTTDYYDETITVRFDDREPRKYSVSESSSGESEYLFIDNATKFINELKTSDSVKVKCMFYDHGSEVFTFYTAGFEWKKP